MTVVSLTRHIGAIGTDTQEFTSKATYDTWFKAQNWNNFVLDQDDKYEIIHLGGDEFVGLSEFHTLPKVGHFSKDSIDNGIINKAKEQGVEISRIRFWANTAGYVEDKYRVEITGHVGGTGIGAINILLVIGIFSVIGLLVAATFFLLMGVALYKAITGIVDSIKKYLPWIIGAAAVVLVVYFVTRRPKEPKQESIMTRKHKPQVIMVREPRKQAPKVMIVRETRRRQ